MRIRTLALLLGLVMLAVLGEGATTALAETPDAGWEITARTFPTQLQPGSPALIWITLYNTGAAGSTGPVTVTDVLPEGLEARKAGDDEGDLSVTDLGPTSSLGRKGYWNCQGTTVVTCTSNLEQLPAIPPGQLMRLGIAVQVQPNAVGGSLNRVAVAGGGALSGAGSAAPIVVGSGSLGFELTDFDGWFSNADGTSDTQAGSHPYAATFSLDFATVLNSAGEPLPRGGEARNIVTDLPPGLLGNPTAIPQCPRALFDRQSCPPPTQVGIDGAYLGGLGFAEFPVYNLAPPPGDPAQFGFDFYGTQTFLDASVRSGGDYGISEHVDNLAQRRILFNVITLWGVPGEANHDPQRRGLNCLNGCGVAGALVPFLTLPTSCEGPQRSVARIDTWGDSALTSEASFLTHDALGSPTGFTGCDHLGFAPSISIAPDTTAADTPAGLTAEVKVVQEGLSTVEGLSPSNLRNTTVTLPEGVVINPGQAAGLLACQPAEAAIGTEGPPACPSASKVGTVSIATPLLPDKLEGNVYVLQSNPPNLQLLVAASADGVNLKLIGDVHLDEVTGRLTTTFANTPELPFTDFKLSFSGGAQAALDTPPTCGLYSSGTDFDSWAAPALADVLADDSFAIESGPSGSGCASPLPFNPTLTAGATTDQAGGYTGFSLLLQRADAQQRISTLSFKTPEGLLGMISKVPLCGEPQAAQGTCAAASQIGHTVVAAGPGPYPLVVPEPGQPAAPIYLTGGYRGAPYGLSIAVPVIAGPFNLGTVVVRASISVDPHTAQLTVTTDPLPAILDGIPTDLRTVNAVIDRPGFMFNPTNCDPQSFSGVATSTVGTAAAISSPFQVGSCRSLTFKPDFRVSTQGRTSRKNGASLDAKILYPTGPLGANQASQQSNIASVKVDLPKQLPSRLTTLQKACTAAQFDANPAGCPKASLVGHATAVTPVLPVALSGPAYFVSRGGEAFPQLIVVLQGYGVTVDLVGDTFISKAGITSSTFKQVPDVPITSFDLSLPEGPYSALAANLPASAKGSFCGRALKLPTAFTGQDGAVIHQSTKITVSGCARHKSAKAKPNRKLTATRRPMAKRSVHTKLPAR
jgi:hypothetical protein